MTDNLVLYSSWCLKNICIMLFIVALLSNSVWWFMDSLLADNLASLTENTHGIICTYSANV